MLPLLLATAVMAAPPGFEKVDDAHGCALWHGTTEADGVTPLLAQCHWPEVDPARLAEMLGDFSRYDEYIGPIERSTVVRQEGGRSLVHQVQVTRGISTREVLVWMERTELEGGGHQVTWTTAGDEPLDLAKGNVRSPRNEGHWAVSPHPDGGARVEHLIAYDPGGSVPGWIVRWFSTGGLKQVMKDVRDVASR